MLVEDFENKNILYVRPNMIRTLIQDAKSGTLREFDDFYTDEAIEFIKHNMTKINWSKIFIQFNHLKMPIGILNYLIENEIDFPWLYYTSFHKSKKKYITSIPKIKALFNYRVECIDFNNLNFKIGRIIFYKKISGCDNNTLAIIDDKLEIISVSSSRYSEAFVYSEKFLEGLKMNSDFTFEGSLSNSFEGTWQGKNSSKKLNFSYEYKGQVCGFDKVGKIHVYNREEINFPDSSFDNLVMITNMF